MCKVKSKGIKVKIHKTEKIRRELLEKNLLNKNLKIVNEENYSIIPINNDNNLELDTKDYEIVEKKFDKSAPKIGSYQEILDIPTNLIKEVPSSYDVIGDIALVKINSNLLKYKAKIGRAILKANKNIKTVCNVKPVSGELRTRDIEIIAGKKKTETFHKEFGINLFVDIGNVYFSPRLANERKRISDLVKDGEVIIDMFTGVAPFPILISKFSNPKMIYAVDKNKKAVEIAEKNIKLNKMLGKINVICGDSKNIKNYIPNKLKADRIIMNLPFSSYEFLKSAFKVGKNKFIIHYYEIIDENSLKTRIKDLKRIFSNNNLVLENVKVNKIKSYTPREFYICFDITAKKKSYADVA